jgi:hypothetical protein
MLTHAEAVAKLTGKRARASKQLRLPAELERGIKRLHEKLDVAAVKPKKRAKPAKGRARHAATMAELEGRAVAQAAQPVAQVSRPIDLVRGDAKGAVFQVPIKTVSEANRASSEHWRKRDERALKQRAYARGFFDQLRIRDQFRFPLEITLTRIAPSKGVDPFENLPGSLKHVVDGICDALGCTDGPDETRVRFMPAKQRRGRYAVEVEICEIRR